MAVSLFFYYCCPLNLMDQKKTGQKWFKETMQPGVPDWRTSGLSNCAIISLKDRIILAIKELLKKTLRVVIVNVILKLLII